MGVYSHILIGGASWELTRRAHALGRRFKALGGAWYQVHEVYTARAGNNAVWIDFHGTVSVLKMFD